MKSVATKHQLASKSRATISQVFVIEFEFTKNLQAEIMFFNFNFLRVQLRVQSFLPSLRKVQIVFVK